MMVSGRALKVFLLTCLVFTGSIRGDDGETVETDPDDWDFKVQGEYAGEFELNGQGIKLGVQVIALGNGKFQSVTYVGGLPGAGWSRGDRIVRANGSREGDVVKFAVDDNENIAPFSGEGLWKSGKLIGKRTDGADLICTKVVRRSPTLGKKPPARAEVLFDGTGTDAWKNGRMTDAKHLAATNVYSKKKLKDHQFHLEFRTPFMPKARGQGRGNSGVYLQSRYEVQVLDSFGLEGRNNECGGIYSISEPIVNMCLPPMTWQTYDVSFSAARYDEAGKKTRNARVTIRHNGVLIHDDLELTHGTPGRHPEGPGPESLFLQDHGNAVVFRNVWVLEK